MDSETDWIWDFWTIRDGGPTHLYFLAAPRSLGDPELRHRHARVGHATSTDLIDWSRCREALGPQPSPAYDDLATWTGSAVADPAGGWRMFTSGLSAVEHGQVQRVGVSTSEDLTDWHRTDWVLEADPRWYLLADHRDETHWRDPFVIQGDDGTWHMYLTAKAGREGPTGWREPHGNGVVGHATSRDLVDWTVQPPIAGPTGRFDQLEVVSLAQVEGRWAVVFSCLGPEVVGAGPGDGGIWTVPVAGPGAPFDLAAAVRLTGEELYVGRVVLAPDGRPVLLAFRNDDGAGQFVGGVIDPRPIGWRTDGRGLVLLD